MGLEAALSSAAEAINELRDSLEEDTLSPVSVSGSVATFTVTAEGKAYDFSATFSDESATLTCSTSVRGLAKANGKLAVHASLARALAAAGRCVAVDLDWVHEAEEHGSGSDADMADASAGHGDGGSDGDDAADELLREWSKRLVKVQKIEAEAEARDMHNIPGSDIDAFQQRQIFDPRAAFHRLENEMEEIFKAQDFNLMAEASDAPDGLYRWHVTLGGFDPASALAADLQQAGRRFGASAVQLQLVFKRPLHPFYPPAVQLVAPRFHGPVLSAVASHPVFNIRGWDPTFSARDVLLLLKQFLQTHARIDFESPRNAAPLAYLPVEVLLAKLEALTGAAAAAQSMQQFQELYRMREAQAQRQQAGLPAQHQQQQQPAASAAQAKPPPQQQQSQQQQAPQQQPQQQPANKKQRSGLGGGSSVVWKAGQGYGHRSDGGGQVWDAVRADMVQAARDSELADVLDELVAELAASLAPGAPEADRADCVAALGTSCLAAYLTHELHAASFQDMAARQKFYYSLLSCADALCGAPAAAPLLVWSAPGSRRTVATALERLQAQASHFVRVYEQQSAAPAAGSSKGESNESEEDKRELALANRVLEVAKRAAQAAAATARDSAAAAPASDAEQSADEVYRQAMSQYRVRMVEGVATNHSHAASARNEAVQPKLRARRVGRELASCESDLPISASSSVFVVADEANSNLWKAIITGPENTPYCGGCFLFDIYFPPEYPRVPPKVLIRTTGSGTVRFNPNLYNEGKVCLSLLGTWQGGRGESWSPEYSTVLQVLISIQSLILVDEPWYNEPGYEQRADEGASNRYSAGLMPSTIKWAMLDQLQHPPAYFADVIREHFRLRGDFILDNCRRWVAWCKEKGQGGHGRQVEQQLPALEAELKKLKEGGTPAS